MTQLLSNFRTAFLAAEAHLQMLGLLSQHKLLMEGEVGILLLAPPSRAHLLDSTLGLPVGIP